MNWPVAMLGVVMLLYIGASVGYVAVNRPAKCVVFIGYAIATCGLIWYAWK